MFKAPDGTYTAGSQQNPGQSGLSYADALALDIQNTPTYTPEMYDENRAKIAADPEKQADDKRAKDAAAVGVFTNPRAVKPDGTYETQAEADTRVRSQTYTGPELNARMTGFIDPTLDATGRSNSAFDPDRTSASGHNLFGDLGDANTRARGAAQTQRATSQDFVDQLNSWKPPQAESDLAKEIGAQTSKVDQDTVDANKADRDNALKMTQDQIDRVINGIGSGGGGDETGLNADIIDQLLNGPLASKNAMDQALASQTALARSARGGPGAVQDALNTAQQQAPSLLAAGSQQMAAEQQQRAQVAGGLREGRMTAIQNAISPYVGQTENQANRDLDQAKTDATNGEATLGYITQVTGFEFQASTAQMQQLGEMGRHFADLGFNYDQLSDQDLWKLWDDMTSKYNVDTQVKGQVEIARMAGKIKPKDLLNALVGVAGGAATVVATAEAGPAAGAATRAATTNIQNQVA